MLRPWGKYLYLTLQTENEFLVYETVLEDEKRKVNEYNREQAKDMHTTEHRPQMAPNLIMKKSSKKSIYQ